MTLQRIDIDIAHLEELKGNLFYHHSVAMEEALSAGIAALKAHNAVIREIKTELGEYCYTEECSILLRPGDIMIDAEDWREFWQKWINDDTK